MPKELKSRRKKIFFNLLIFLASGSLSLIMAEFTVRAFHLSKTYDSYPWQLDQRARNINYKPEKNSFGFRDYDYSLSKKTGAFRIVCIGDSVTEGYRVKLPLLFSKLLESSLREKGYKNVEVMDMGSCGNATKENLATVKKSLSFGPDLIIYQFGLNDIERFPYYKESMEVNNLPTARPFSFKQIFRRSALYCAVAERYNYLKLKLGQKNWSFGEWNDSDEAWQQEFAKFKAMLNGLPRSTKIIFLNMPYDFQVFSNRNEVFIPARKWIDFCRANGCGFIDFTAIFKAQKEQYGIFLDDCHLSERGHRIVSECLERYILGNHYL